MRPYLQHDGQLPISHRGGAGVWPENTLFAFQRSYDLGYRWIETDVHLTLDGEVVLLHDDTLDRTTDGTGRIAEMRLAEVQELDAGYHTAFRGEGARVPTLREAMAMAPDLRLNLEIKAPFMADALIREITALGVEDRVLVASAQDDLIQEYREKADGLTVTSAARNEIVRYWFTAHFGRPKRPAFDALQVPPRYYGGPVVTRRFVRVAHDLGLRVHVWTIDEPAEMNRLLDLGVDAVMTDQPQVLLDVMRARRSPDPLRQSGG